MRETNRNCNFAIGTSYIPEQQIWIEYSSNPARLSRLVEMYLHLPLLRNKLAYTLTVRDNLTRLDEYLLQIFYSGIHRANEKKPFILQKDLQSSSVFMHICLSHRFSPNKRIISNKLKSLSLDNNHNFYIIIVEF